MVEVKLCKTKAVYSTKNQIDLDFDKIRNNFKVVEDTPIVMVIDEEGEIIVHKHGELLFKELRDTEKIKLIAEKVYEVGK